MRAPGVWRAARGARRGARVARRAGYAARQAARGANCARRFAATLSRGRASVGMQRLVSQSCLAIRLGRVRGVRRYCARVRSGSSGGGGPA
eukprot:8517453-Lingulodinium_polyedra.AAC.1